MPDLREFLQRTFEKSGGAISFEDYMAMALYDPRFGYYATAIEEVGGSRGDFATAATLTPALGRAIAKWVGEEREHHDWSGPVHLVEVGAGNGVLAREVLRSMGWWKRRQVRFHIVEVSEPLRRKQEEILKPFHVTWHKGVADALVEAEGRALVFSNELVDAFPAKWLAWSEIEGHWHEVFVTFDGGAGLAETFRRLPSAFPADAYSSLGLRDLSQGQRVEIQPLYQRWLGNLSEKYREGSLLTIDYGGEPGEVYHRKPEGTVRAYYRQERFEGSDVYRRFGKQDLTVDVNFRDLVNWGEDFGWETARLETQGEFLRRHGESDDAMAGEGVGEAFRVLLQRR